MVDKDPMKDLVNMVREEMKQSREHDMQLYQLTFNNFAHNVPRQIPEAPGFYQQNSYYQGHGFPFDNPNSINHSTVSRSDAFNVQLNLFPEGYPYGSSSCNSNASAKQQHN